MADCNELLMIIKQASVDAVNAGNPSGIYFGTVVSSSPIKIKIDTKLVLNMAQLVLTRSVTDYEVDMNILSGETAEANPEGHRHDIKGVKKVKIMNGLKTGDSVILARVQGGQQYIVLDKVG